MKSKKNAILLIIMYAICLSGCSSNVYEKDYLDSNSTTKGTSINLLSIDDRISQIGMNSNQAVSNNGLYYVQDNKIFYYDFNTKKSLNWCTIPNCNHENVECSGYMGEDLFISKYIFFHDSHIYKISKDDNGAYLEQYKEDGSEQVRIGKLWDKNSYVLDDNALISTGCVKMDHGTVFFLINDDYKTVKLCSMDLKAGAIPKVMYEYGAGSEKVSVNSFMISDGFAAFSILLTNNEEKLQNIHVVNLEEQTDESYVADIPYFGLSGNTIIYSDPENPEDIMSYNLTTKENKKIIDVDADNKYPAYYNNIICTKDNILLDNEIEAYYGISAGVDIKHIYKIYDYEGVCIKEVPAEQFSLMSFEGRIITALKPEKNIEILIYLMTNENGQSEWNKLR